MQIQLITISEKILQPLHKIHYLTKSLLAGDQGKINTSQSKDIKSLQICAKDAIVETHAAFELINTEDYPTLFTVAHDLLTPSANLLGFSELLLEGLDGELTAEQRLNVQKIYTLGQINRVQTYTLVDYARIQSGYEAILHQIPVADLIPIDLGFLVCGKDITLEYHIEDNLPDVYSSHLLIQQTITNLVANAAAFTPAGNIRIDVSLQPSKSEVLVSICDTGIGIAPQHFDSVFEPFWKLDPQSTGTGLGLFVCREFIRLQGGDLWLESKLAEGTIVSFTMNSFNSVRGSGS